MRHLLNTDEWLVIEQGFDMKLANIQETLFTIGNGYHAVRASLEEGHSGDLSGSYLAGVYDDHDSPVIDLVNAPSWLSLFIYVDGQRLDVETCEVTSHERCLDLRQGLLYRKTVFKDSAGRNTQVESLRFCSFADQHLSAMRVCITPLDHSSRLSVTSGIDGRRRNLDRMPVYPKGYVFNPRTKWEKWTKSTHLEMLGTGSDDGCIALDARTIASNHILAFRSCHDVDGQVIGRRVSSSHNRVDEVFEIEGHAGKPVTIDKLATIYTSRDSAPGDTGNLALASLVDHRHRGFDAALDANATAWFEKWSSCDCVVEGDSDLTRAVRFNIYQLLIAANENDPKVNIGAKSMTGEGYRGHIFWDTEIFTLPFYIYTRPAAAKALLLYRYHTLAGALENARANGFKGAQFAWESADSGRETTPKWTDDGLQRIWTGEEEIHVSADVAYGIITYVGATNDFEFLRDYGAEILFQTSRFWASRLEWNAAAGRYELTKVIGPDEFHEHVDNNAFTNRMVQWHLHKTVEVFTWFNATEPDVLSGLCERLCFTKSEIQEWRDIADRIYIPYDSNETLIEQFQGYFERDDVQITDWDENAMPVYPKGLNHFTCNGTMLLKQPDVVMLLHVLSNEFTKEVKQKNYEFYEKRTMHKSSLSPSVHAIFSIQVGNYEKSLQYLARSAFVDLHNNQGNTQDGIHIASAGGTWQAIVFGFGGFSIQNGEMIFQPWIPESWTGLRFKLQCKGREVSVEIRHGDISLLLNGMDCDAEQVTIFGWTYTLRSGTWLNVKRETIHAH
jgi:kojibiose phosphorylase